MVEIKITEQERNRLLTIGGSRFGSGGHWGNGELLIPEEQIIYKRIKESDGTFRLSFYNLNIFCEWYYEATGEGALMLRDDIPIVEKIFNAVIMGFSRLEKKTKSDLVDVERILEILSKLVPELESYVKEFEEKIKFGMGKLDPLIE